MSRLAKKIDGEAKQKVYISRSQAIKKLQLSLSEFRRVCILKGIFPREPKNKRKLAGGSSADKTFYALRDIKSLMHEPVLGTVREMKSFSKKVSRYAGRNEPSKIKSLKEFLKPEMDLDHLVRERYPTFEDALEDLDDALSMIFLFASLPIPPANPNSNGIVDERKAVSQECYRLAREFEAWLIATGLLTKSFLSVKGIYYRAEINGKKITWIVPHELSTSIPADVDFKVMLTFLDFYRTLLSFVNLRLFKQIGWEYPLKTPEMATLIQKNLNEWFPISELLPECKFPRKCNLFSGMTFYLGREVPKRCLAFALQAMGAQVGWDNMEGLPLAVDSESDANITHQITDRPSVATFYADRKYVQPQWVFDCLNAGQVLPTEAYAPSAALPPHFSPFSEETEVVLPVDPEAAKMTSEEKELAKSMLTKRQKIVYERIQRSRSKTISEREKIEKRRIDLAHKKQK